MKLTLSILEPYRQRKAAYQSAFKSGSGPQVLADLAVFCRANETTAVGSDMAMLEGRRQVYIRIMKHLNFTPEELAVLYDASLRIPQE